MFLISAVFDEELPWLRKHWISRDLGGNRRIYSPIPSGASSLPANLIKSQSICQSFSINLLNGRIALKNSFDWYSSFAATFHALSNSLTPRSVAVFFANTLVIKGASFFRSSASNSVQSISPCHQPYLWERDFSPSDANLMHFKILALLEK